MSENCSIFCDEFCHLGNQQVVLIDASSLGAKVKNGKNQKTLSTEFAAKMQGFSDNPDRLFKESAGLEREIRKQLVGLRYG